MTVKLHLREITEIRFSDLTGYVMGFGISNMKIILISNKSVLLTKVLCFRLSCLWSNKTILSLGFVIKIQ